MRQIYPQQCELGQSPIETLEFDLHSRDDIPQLLRGLQHIYSNPTLREVVFAHLEKLIPAGVDWHTGRPGMALWNAFVLAELRVNLNCDYDRVVELANEHQSLRQMLGHGGFAVEVRYCRETVRENLQLLSVEVLDKINQAVVKAGHELLGEQELSARCDSFVVESGVDYPTDISLLNDAVRKVIMGCGQAAKQFGLANWRQYQYNYRCFKQHYRKAQRLRHSSSKDEAKKAAQQDRIIQAHQALIECAQGYLQRAQDTLKQLEGLSGSETLCAEISYYQQYAQHQIELVQRRVINDETIPHADKVFSLFKPYTEWISKGKAGVPMELGLRVCVMEDQCGFLLHHQVMSQQTDEQVAVDMVRGACERFPQLKLCSFDKGFWKPDNLRELETLLDTVVLPKKGGLSQQDRERQSSPEFIQAIKQHSAVESAINALEVHGLDSCPDYGLDRFERYVALAVVGRNIQKLGAILLQRQHEAERRRLRRAA